MYNEAQSLGSNMRELAVFLRANSIKYNLILVDDGSRDNSFNVMKELAKELPCTLLSFTRNFGKEAAICAGIAESKGAALIVMDADLQHPMEMIPVFIEKWKEGNLIVEGVKRSRGREGLFYKFAAKSFYKIFGKLTKLDMLNSSDFKLLDRRCANDFTRLGESAVFFRGMVSWLGYKGCTVPFDVQDRRGDKKSFSTRALFKMAFNAITTYSDMPLYLTNIIGTVFVALGSILGVQTLLNYMLGNAQSGFTTVILLSLIGTGAVLLSLGVIGMYLSKIYEEVKGRPRYIVRERLISDEENFNRAD